MSYDLTLYEFLKSNLTVCRRTINGDETYIRCPYCGDSKTNPKDAHFYINNKAPFKFYCQKCNVTGVFSTDVLRKLGLFDNEINKILKDSVIKYKMNLNKKYGMGFDRYFSTKEIILEPRQYDSLEMNKIEYLEKRLGIILTDDDIPKYKIITNLYDFLEQNNINTERRSEFENNKIQLLNDHYIGFLCNDKNMITFRNIKDDEEERYFNFKIFKETVEYSKKFFTIKNNIDLSSRVFNIYLTEGIFDIIGVFNHLYNGNLNNNDIFVGCNGKGYNFVLNYLKSIGFLNCDINIYSDNDVKLSYFNKLKSNNLLIDFNGANIYYNNIGKDFGVTKDKIELKSPFKI